MYNIIKYRFIFFGCLAIIFLFLFMNSTKIVEGARSKKKSSSSSTKKSTPASENTQNEPMSEETQSGATGSGATGSGATGSRATTSTSVIQSINTKTDKKIREQVNKILPSMLANAISPAVNEIKKTQETLNLNMKTVDKKMESFNKTYEDSTKNLNDKKDNSLKEVGQSAKNFSKLLSQQYDMYKNGLQNEATTATKSIGSLKADISGASDDIMKAKTETKKYSDLSKQVYDNVFGAISARIVQQDNIEYTKERFTPMNDGGYVSKDLFNLEKKVIDEINNFNTIYYNYVSCKTTGSIAQTCKTDSDVTTASNRLIVAINDLQTAYSNAGAMKDSSTFSANHQEIKTKSQEIDDLRRTLDSKMESILKGSPEVKQELDSTVYAGIMWSVLATSLLFVIFS
jgi:predicted  nucleic acid-binding Zn-ribbon protein